MATTKDKVMQAMRELPQLPVAVQKLLAVMRDENSSADDVTKVLSSDQALAGKILKLVNSSFYGMSGEVSTITRAVVVLGFSGVRNVAMGFGMVSALKKLGGVSLATFWDHAIATGAGAQAMAPRLGSGHDPEEAFIAGLMHDVGHVVLASAVPQEWAEAQERVQAGGDPIAIEKDLLGMSHASVGQRLMAYWQLPTPLAEAARWHHNLKIAAGREQPLTTLTALGDVLACIHGGTFEAPPSEADLGRLLRLSCLEISHVREALAGMDGRIEEMKVFLKIADDGESLTTNGGPCAGQAGRSVVLSSDQERVAWVGGLLEHFGCPGFPLRAYFEQEAGHQDVRLVVLDPNSLTKPQLQKILPFLDQQAATICVLRDSEPGPIAELLLQRYPALPYVFTRRDVAVLLATETART
ncbi:MAG: HDOD domain-containing protein [Candidatus Krumholzibacteriia bacterium]